MILKRNKTGQLKLAPMRLWSSGPFTGLWANFISPQSTANSYQTVFIATRPSKSKHLLDSRRKCRELRLKGIPFFGRNTDIEQSEYKSKLVIYCSVMKSNCTCVPNSHDLCRDISSFPITLAERRCCCCCTQKL